MLAWRWLRARQGLGLASPPLRYTRVRGLGTGFRTSRKAIINIVAYRYYTSRSRQSVILDLNTRRKRENILISSVIEYISTSRTQPSPSLPPSLPPSSPFTTEILLRPSSSIDYHPILSFCTCSVSTLTQPNSHLKKTSPPSNTSQNPQYPCIILTALPIKKRKHLKVPL